MSSKGLNRTTLPQADRSGTIPPTYSEFRHQTHACLLLVLCRRPKEKSDARTLAVQISFFWILYQSARLASFRAEREVLL